MNSESSLNLSIIIPCYNESSALQDLLAEILALSLDNSEIIIVDDGSTDSCTDIATKFAPTVRLIKHPYNIGNGAAVKTGIRAARGRFLLLLDADGQHLFAQRRLNFARQLRAPVL